MRILITGITGFAGVYLTELLLTQPGVVLFGASREGRWPEEAASTAARVDFRTCDLSDPAVVEAVLREAQPEVIYHLAGYSHAGRSSREPDAAWTGNLTVTRCLYDAILRWGGRPRILFVSSALIYGDCDPPERAHDEHAELRPATPYAVSKAAADLLSYQYAQAEGLDIVRVRPFNHIGPRQSPEFALPHFAQQIAAIERGRRPAVLETGNLTPRRDLTDVRDMVRAYRLLAERGRKGEAYNAGTGHAYSMQEVLDRLLALAGQRVEVRRRADLVRAAENNVVRADPSKLSRETGWAPTFRLEQTLTDILAYWRLRS
jgi:GDP-4-dehydro-6-deoxy-D-mannose reductase